MLKVNACYKTYYKMFCACIFIIITIIISFNYNDIDISNVLKKRNDYPYNFCQSIHFTRLNSKIGENWICITLYSVQYTSISQLTKS